MGTTVKATFQVQSWDEGPFDERPGLSKLTRASVTKEYSGDIEGESATEWLMAYAADGAATFVGLERIRGTITGRQGSVVLQHVGGYADGAARASLTVVPGSGTDQLGAVAGGGNFVADPSGSVALDLSFE